MKVTKRKAKKKTADLSITDVIVQSIQDKKGENIVIIDLREIPDTATDFFIICDADNTTQVRAIATNLMEETQIQLGEKPWHYEGLRELEWVLIDYVNIVVHVFHRPTRAFYQLEELWSDGIVTEMDEVPKEAPKPKKVVTKVKKETTKTKKVKTTKK